jgi:cytochrome c peroxidase
MRMRMERITMWIATAALATGCVAADEVSETAQASSATHEGRRLFEDETFGGNGRTCQTCHAPSNGTLTLAQIDALFQQDPNGPLFRGDGTDDGAGHGTSRIRTDGTILVSLELPPGVTVLDDPTATHVTLRHGIPSTMNTPALDPVLMYDGRAPDLIEQARGAIHDHTATTIEPTEHQLELIAEHQTTEDFFTSQDLRKFANGGPAPRLPEGNTASEKRGRRFFDNVPLAPPSTRGMCAICHSGPMLDASNGLNPLPVPPFFVPAGTRFQSILSGELLPNGDPVRSYQFTDPDGNVQVAVSSDPGRAMQTGDFRGFPFGDIGVFKIPSLWNIKATAPYFHNNAAKTLEEVVDHYTTFFIIATPIVLPGQPPIVISPQDKQDLIAFLKLL